MEQDPKEILFAVKACIKDVTRKLDVLGMKINEIVTVGITNQRETTIVWDAITGDPLYNAIGGQRLGSLFARRKLFSFGEKPEKSGLLNVQHISCVLIDLFYERSLEK